MAVTALEVPTGGIVIKTKVVSTPTDEGLYIQLYRCDDNWKEIGKPQEYGDTVSEEEYHTALRENATNAKHFKQEYSTNPEWSPESKTK